MMIALLIALRFIPLHTIEGYIVMVNPEMVTTLTARKFADPKLIHREVRCLIGLSDSRFISVTETCDVVRKLMEGSN